LWKINWYKKMLNKKNKQIKRNQIKGLIRPMNRHRNCLKWGKGETNEHIQRKLDICKQLKKEGKEFYTEAIFKTGDRADVVNADDGIVYEVYESETKKSLEQKRKKYPLEDIRFINAKAKWREELIK